MYARQQCAVSHTVALLREAVMEELMHFSGTRRVLAVHQGFA